MSSPSLPIRGATDRKTHGSDRGNNPASFKHSQYFKELQSEVLFLLLFNMDSK